MKRNFSEIWERTEPKAIKIVLLIYLVLKIFSTIFRNTLITNSMKDAEPILIGILVLFIFRYIEKKMNYKNEFETITNFQLQLPNYFFKKEYNEILIFALNGHYYSELIKNNKLKIKKLTLLLRIPDKQSVLYPKMANDKDIFDSMMQNEVENFKSLVKEKIVEELEIRYYNFDSLLYFMVVDNEWMHFGLLKPIDNIPGAEVLNSHFFNNKNETGRDMIRNFKNEFECIKKEYSIEKSSVKHN